MKLGQLVEVEFEKERLPVCGDVAYIDGFLYLTHMPSVSELLGRIKSIVYNTDRFSRKSDLQRSKKVKRYRHPFEEPPTPEYNSAKGWVRFPVEMQRDKLGQPTFILG